ncbi:HMA2 domain-containing protein [Anabaena sp. CCY 0017]|uniref:HMA2 domain-containing protein n=1 Tax=Anabaena sp. CCY 0017 TaxID=3103866 RepID=UPI0039C5DE0E
MTINVASYEWDSQIKNHSPEVAQSEVQFSVEKLQIVHATNGRIRIRATDGSFHPKLESISQDLRQYPGVKEVCVNQQTGSLVVTFDETLLSSPQMLDILQGFDIQQIPVSNNIDAFAAWKSRDFWQEQSVSLIPLMTGLAVTGGLGISGLAAIPVYMMTADATRRVIDYLEPKFSGSEVEKATRSSILTGDRSTLETPLSDHPTLAYTVVHAIPGRIRFHLPRLAQDSAYRRRLESLLTADPQVVKVRVNDHAASIAIAYQPANVNITHWVSLMELALETPPSANSARISSQHTEIIRPNISSLWAEMKYPGMSFSLEYMANLWS